MKKRLFYFLLCVSLIILKGSVAALVLDRQDVSREYYANIPTYTPNLNNANIQLKHPLECAKTNQTFETFSPAFPTEFKELPSFIGWIYSEGTKINYPIMQGSDNEYYLSHLPDGREGRQGAIYIDFRNAGDFTDRHTLIYGHDMRSQDMFGSLKNYRRQEYYDLHPTIIIETLKKRFELVVFSAYLVDAAREAPRIFFYDDKDFKRYVYEIKARSIFKSDVQIAEIDRIVSLCTCSTEYEHARLIVVGKLVEIGKIST